MAKNTNRVARAIACVAALGLATGVWANDAYWELSVEDQVTYAQEIFGGDAAAANSLELTLMGDDSTTSSEREGTRVKLLPSLPDGQSVGTGSRAEVTVTLKDAVFGDAVQWTDIVVGSQLEKRSGTQKDGRTGDSSVTFQIDVDNDGFGGGDAANAFVTVYLGALKNAGGLKADGGMVTASATVAVLGGPTVATDNFPTKAMTGDCEKSTTGTPARPTTDAFSVCGTWTDGAEGFLTGAVADKPATSSVVAKSAKALTFDAKAGVGGSINIEDRTKLGGGMTKVSVASFTKVANSEAVNASGKVAFSEVEGKKANVTVTVSGMIKNPGDTLFLDYETTDGKADGKAGTREIIPVSAGGTFSLDSVASGTTLYFVPGGTAEMKRGYIEASFKVKYDSTSAVPPEAVGARITLDYEGAPNLARAYAIPNAGMGDIGNVRIRCNDTTSECTVFLDCYGQDGVDYFGELDSSISSGATTVLQAEAIGDVIGTDAWAGRLSCDVLSDKDISVQVLVRSDGSLINNTYVD